MPPNRFICRAAMSWPGMVGQTRVVDLRRPLRGGSGTPRPARRCRSAGPSARRGSSGRAAPAMRRTGPATAPMAFWWKAICSARSRSRTTTAPPMTSEWPPAYLVVECTTTSAPRVSGCLEVRRGEGVVDHEQRARVVGDRGEGLDVADVEQRVGRRLDPDQPGLARPDRGARRRRGRTPGPGRARSPHGVRDLVEEPEGAAVRVVGQHARGRPGRHSARITVSSAARPLAKANPRSPSSSAAMLPSSAVRVGLAERLYS